MSAIKPAGGLFEDGQIKKIKEIASTSKAALTNNRTKAKFIVVSSLEAADMVR